MGGRFASTIHLLTLDLEDFSFIGQDGKLLARSFDPKATYEAKESDGYFRATVRASDGARAWTQPVFLPSAKDPG